MCGIVVGKKEENAIEIFVHTTITITMDDCTESQTSNVRMGLSSLTASIDEPCRVRYWRWSKWTRMNGIVVVFLLNDLVISDTQKYKKTHEIYDAVTCATTILAKYSLCSSVVVNSNKFLCRRHGFKKGTDLDEIKIWQQQPKRWRESLMSTYHTNAANLHKT